MGPTLATNRRRTDDPLRASQDDVRADLITLAIKGIVPMVSLSVACLVAASSLAAFFIGDRWLWVMAFASLLIGGLRVVSTVVFSMRVKRNLSVSAAFWTPVFAILTILFSSMMGTLTVYNFRFHAQLMQSLCIMGTFALCSGISARMGLHPRVSQFCIVIMNGCLAFALLSSPLPFVRGSSFLCVVTAFTYCISIQNQYKVLEEQVRSRRRLRNLADHDSLTGLPNRRQFEARMQRVCASHSPFTLWMIDLDGFKEVNDTHGHAVGDELLRQVARRLEHSLRAEDMIARLGGDEFVILQAFVHSRASTQKLAERLKAEISAPYQIDGDRIVINASTGIKVAESGQDDPNAALIEADRALYRAKGAGHGGFEFA